MELVSFLSVRTDQFVVYESVSGSFYRNNNLQRLEARISKSLRARTSNGGGFGESAPPVTPVTPRQVFGRSSWIRWETVPLHMHLVASALHDVQHVEALLRGDSRNRTHFVWDLLPEACFRLHCTKVENEDLSTRLTAERAQVKEKKLEVQLWTRRIGALETRLEAFTAMHDEGVAPAIG